MVNKPDKNVLVFADTARTRQDLRHCRACPRLDVFRSAKHIYSQVIDDEAGVTLASASSMEKTLKDYGGNATLPRRLASASRSVP